MIRSGGVATNLSMSHFKISYGNMAVGDAITAAIGPACENQNDGTCLTTTEDAPSLKQKTSIYTSDTELPSAGTLTFTPAGSFGDDMGTSFVTALANLGKAFQTSQVQSWSVCDTIPCQKYGGSPTKGSDTFYVGPAEFHLLRYDTATNAQIDFMTLNVYLSEKNPTAEIWCDISGVAGLISGCFDPALGALFGTVTMFCPS